MKAKEQTLTAPHLEHLRTSAIDEDIIADRGYRTITSKIELLELEPRFTKAQQRVPGILIPIYKLGDPKPYTYILRPDNPRKDSKSKPVKYELAKGVSPCLDVLPKFKARLGDPNDTLWFTEGAKKADALASLGVTAIDVNGVFGWRGKNKLGGKTVLVDFEHIAWEGRRVVLAFDSDYSVNKNVRLGLSRLAGVLVNKGAEVLMLPLPHSRNGKTGVDDFLAELPEGGRLSHLEQMLTPYEGAGHGITKAYTHPVTLEDCYHPPGYFMQGGLLAYTNPATERTTPVYNGDITVTALGNDAETGAQTLTVAFKLRGELRTVTAPRAELATARRVIEHLGAQGAAVHEGNARHLAAYLVEFASLNDEALPYSTHIARYGLLEDGGLIAPARGIGTATRYEGGRRLTIGKNENAYREALREVLTWGGVWPLWFTLGASLAAPAIARLRLRRSPAIFLSGESGSGKTTAAQFSTGAWAHPEVLPLRIEAGRTTRAGYLQALTEAGGLPVFIDEAHTAARPADLESVVYQFANGQSYAKGSPGGVAKGGEPLRGAVILAGEALPEFVNAGAQRRVLYIPAEDFPPLGAEAYSNLGRARAKVLESAWTAGAGHLGPMVAEAIWQDFDAFRDSVNELENAYSNLGAWAPAVAVVVATLDIMFDVLGLELPAELQELGKNLEKALELSRERADPARVAFEAIAAMLAQGRKSTFQGVESISLNHELIGWYRDGKWHVITSSPQFKARVGAQAVQLYGRTWAKEGRIEPGSKGKSTVLHRSPENGLGTRVLVIDPAALEGLVDEQEV